MKNVLVLIDLQKEYIIPGRPFYLENNETSLANLKQLLYHARYAGWEIWHVRHLQSAPDRAAFCADSPYSGFIDDFMPQQHEQVFLKHDFSCFSNLDFAKAMQELQDVWVFIAGYGSTMCCMATIIEGYGKGFAFQFIADASNAKRTDDFNECILHKAATSILAAYCRITTTSEVIAL